MAELKNYDYAENLEQQSDLQQSNEHQDTRLEQVTLAAQNEVNRHSVDGGLNEFFDDVDARTSNSVNKLQRETRNRVLSLIDSSATSYVNRLQKSSSAKLEQLAWQNYQGDIMARIKNVNANTASSIGVAEGYEIILAETQQKTESEWARQKEANVETMKNFNRWDNWLKGGRYKKFEIAADEEITKLFTELNENVARIKSTAESRNKAMETRVQGIWDATIDPTQKAALWKEVETVTEAAKNNNFAAVKAPLFLGSSPSEQNRVDFVEALARLEFTKKTLGLKQESDQKSREQEDLLESGQKQQELIDLKSNFNFASLKTMPEFAPLLREEKIESAASVKDIVAAITADLNKNNQTEALEKLFKDKAKRSDLLTDTAKLVIITKKLNLAADSAGWRSMLSANTVQMLLDWIEYQDQQTRSRVYQPEEDVKATQTAMDRLRGSDGKGGYVKNLTDILDTSKNLNSTKSRDLGSIEKQYEEAFMLSKNLSLDLSHFEEDKNKYPVGDQETIRKIYTDLLKATQNLRAALGQWVETQSSHKAWNKKVTNAKAYCDRVDSKTESLIGTTEGDKSKESGRSIEAREQRRHAETRYQSILDEEPTHQLLPNIDELRDQIHTWQNTKYNLTEKAEAFGKDNDLDARIKDLMHDEFKKELEAKFIEKMAQVDQYEVLKQLPVGTNVSVTSQMVGATSNIDFPRNLSGKPKPYTLKRVAESEVVLEDGQGNLLRIFGAFAANGEVFKNALLKTKNTDGTYHNGTRAIAYNFKIS